MTASTQQQPTSIPVISVDGPGGSGKGTLALSLAKRLNWHLLDSGALYRLLALAATKQGINANHTAALVNLAQCMDIGFSFIKDQPLAQVYLAKQDVSTAIRTESCAALASEIAAYAPVRVALLERQRAFRQLPGLVADGRDMGTIVFPKADLKIFLTASAEKRACRRYQQLKAIDLNVSLAHLLAEIQVRDERDINRTAAPLQPAKDALIVDSSDLTIAQVEALVWAEIARRKLNKCC